MGVPGCRTTRPCIAGSATIGCSFVACLAGTDGTGVEKVRPDELPAVLAHSSCNGRGKRDDRASGEFLGHLGLPLNRRRMNNQT